MAADSRLRASTRTADDITVDRWQFMAILMLLDPLAIFFATWAGALRRKL